MVQKIGPEELNVVFKFGGGLHTRASADEIDGREAAGGFNFSLDIQDRNLKTRPPFDQINTVSLTGGANNIVGGGGSLLKTDGTITTFFQVGNNIYKWGGGTSNTFTNIFSSVATGSQLRGHWKEHVWNLTDVVLITDLSLSTQVLSFNGTAISTPTFVDQAGNSFGAFYAKYLNIVTERAIFANVRQVSSFLPHLIVGCKQSNFLQITTANTPSSALGTSDPFFIPSPDLKPINNWIYTYLGSMISTERGEIFNLVGTDATNYAFNSFYSNSGAAGQESVCEVGNDFIYGRPGRIESIRDTNTFGNSEATDLTAIVSDQLFLHNKWTITFNSRTRKAYCFPTGFSEVWVLDLAMRDAGQVSPWSRWTTGHPIAFQPTMVMPLLDPADGLEYIFMGDANGNIYRMEGVGFGGSGSGGDAGTTPIETQFQSKLVSARLDSVEYDYEGYIKYRPVGALPTQLGVPASPSSVPMVTLSLQYQGENIFTNSISMTLDTISFPSFYSGGFYYSDGSFYGAIGGRLTRNKFTIPGHANEFQLLIDIQGTTAQVEINEIGIRMRAASQ